MMYTSPVVYSRSPPLSVPPHDAHLSTALKPTIPRPVFFSYPNNKTLSSIQNHSTVLKSTSNSSDSDILPDKDDSLFSAFTADSEFESTSDSDDNAEDDVDIEILKLGKNARRITCRIAIGADLETVWNLLTDYERLADFIPGLAVCQLLEKTDNCARLFQIGQQNLAFGLKFNAKGIIDCYEKDLETIPFGQRRDIDFKMAEGDFQVFEGKWSIEEMDTISGEQVFQTTLTYVVDVKPKLWLPVRLVQGRLCKEIKLNLLCIREQAQKTVQNKFLTC